MGLVASQHLVDHVVERKPNRVLSQQQRLVPVVGNKLKPVADQQPEVHVVDQRQIHVQKLQLEALRVEERLRPAPKQHRMDHAGAPKLNHVLKHPLGKHHV